MLEVVLTCPDGNDCERVADGKLYRCRAYQQWAGQRQNPDGTLTEGLEWMCVKYDVLPALQRETLKQTIGTTAAVESFRNEMVASNERPIVLNLPVMQDPEVLLNG